MQRRGPLTLASVLLGSCALCSLQAHIARAETAGPLILAQEAPKAKDGDEKPKEKPHGEQGKKPPPPADKKPAEKAPAVKQPPPPPAHKAEPPPVPAPPKSEPPAQRREHEGGPRRDHPNAAPPPAPKADAPAPAPKADVPPPPPKAAPAPKADAPPPPPKAGLPSNPPAAAAPPPPANAPPPAPKADAPPPPPKAGLPSNPPAAAAPPAAGAAPPATAARQPNPVPAAQQSERLQDVQKSRTERVEDGGKRKVIVEQDNRIIIKQDNRVIIHHDEAQRFRQPGQDVRATKRNDGTTETVVVRPGGVQLFSVTDGDGRLVRRYRRDQNGTEINIIDNRSFLKPRDVALGVGIGVLAAAAIVALAPPAIAIPREKYVVEYDRASPDDLYEALSAPPVERLERAYSLEEVRYSRSLRERMRRIDLDTINFETGSWGIDADQYDKLAEVARVMLRVIDRHPAEVFLVEGHTDAVGSDIDNLSLSDRRAESVADILTRNFAVPPENLVTQGYGEEFLKVPTQGPERANRRVAIRRITPLLAHDMR